MTIALLCPNGHRLVCPEQQAGKRGKCPQCGATFRVPEVTADNKTASSSGPMPIITGSGSAPRNTESPAAVTIAPSGGPAPAEASEPVAKATEAAPQESAASENLIRPYDDGDAIGEDEIVFLCPDGHHLAGPTSLGGQPGQCPTCGIKFLVPSEEELSEQAAGHEVGLANLAFNFGGGEHAEEEPTGEGNGLVELFDSFWAYKAQGAAVELYLENGQVLTPGGYAPHLSRGAHGVFMIREGNGTHTLAAVRWKSISHVAVRGIGRLPEGVFDVP